MTNIVLTGIVIAAASPILYQIRNVPEQLFKKVMSDIIYSVKIYQHDELFDIMEEWFFDNYETKYRDVEASIRVGESPTPGQPASRSVIFKQEQNVFIARYKGKKIMVSKGKEKLDKATSLRDVFYRHYTIKGYRAKDEINEMIKTIAENHYNKKDQNRVIVFCNTGYGDWCKMNDNRIKPMEKIVLPVEQKNDILSDIDEFISSFDWYVDRAIAYKRAYCFHGLPGNGKTSIALAMANYMKKDVYIINLNSFENDSYLLRAFNTMPSGSIILIEDIDRAFDGRDNVNNNKVSFSILLNCLDGALSKEGVVSIITTNHIDKLDPALIRAGRTDRLIEIKNPTIVEVEKYLELFFGFKVKVEFEVDVSMSKVQEMCIRHKADAKACVMALLNERKYFLEVVGNLS